MVYLGLSPITTAIVRTGHGEGCLCPALGGILWGTLGTILTSVLLLGISFAATSAIGAIIFGLLMGFFALMVVSVACLAKCGARCGYGEL